MENRTATSAASKQTPVLRLELFGGPVLWKGRQAVRVSPLQTMLLALAFSRDVSRIPRPALQRLLWEEDDDRLLRHRLSQLIYQTNRTVGVRIFEPDGEHIRVHRGAVSCDVDDYSATVRSGDFDKAWSILERGFLAACNHGRTSACADWIEEQRIVKRSLLRRAALAVWEKAEAAHEWSQAKRSAEVLLRLDPREETILRRVMRARAFAGQIREAEAVYRAFAERVDASGQWNPEPATTQLLKNVQDMSRDSADGSASSTNGSSVPPLVGRGAELTLLTRSLFRRNPNAGWRTVAVRGEAGVGKTRLVQEAISSARFRGYRVMEASAAQLERRISLSPLLDSLSDPWVLPFSRTLDEPWRSSMLALVPELQQGSKLGSDPSPAYGGELSRHTCDAFLRLFTAIAESQKTILSVDGFQWMDEASIAVLQYLRRRWHRGELTLVVTYCEEEVGIGTSVARFIREEELRASTTSIHVTALDDLAAVKLARSVAPADSHHSRLAVIAKAAGGNPKFVIDLATSPEGDIQPGRSSPDVPIPASVRRLVTRRLESLGADARKVVSGLAVVGSDTSLDRLRVITDSTRAECLDALDTLHRLRLVDWSPQGIGFRHEIFRHAVYHQIHPSRRSVLHARTARLLYRAQGDPALLEAARHYRLAGKLRHASICAHEAVKGADSRDVPSRLRVLEEAHELSQGPRRSLIAARLALVSHDLRRLRSAFRFGAEALEGASGLSPSEAIEVKLATADARHLLGMADTEESLAQLHELEERALAVDAELLLARILDARVQLLDREGRGDAVIAELARLRAMELPAQRAARCRILATLAMQAGYGDADAGLRSGRRSFELARTGDLPAEAVLSGQRLTRALAACGLLATEEGQETTRATRDLAEATGLRGCHAFLLLDLAEWHTAVNDDGIAGRILSEARDLTREMDCPHVRTLGYLARGNLAVGRGDMEEGERVLKAIQDIGTAGSDSNPAPVPGRFVDALAALEGTLLMELGKIQRVNQIAQRHPLPESLGEASLGAILFHARLRSRTGNLTSARELLFSSLEANESPRPLVWLRLSLELARLARRTGDPQTELAQRARERAEKLGLTGLAHEFLPFCAQ